MVDDSDDNGMSFRDSSDDMEEILGLPPTSDLKVMAVVNPEINERRLCIITYTEDANGNETARARIDFDDPAEVIDFAQSLISASKQVFCLETYKEGLN